MTPATHTVMIMAGGTGGHIYPGLAVADVLREKGIGVHWLGAAGGMECETVPAHGIELDAVHISGVRGRGWRGWLALPFHLLRAIRDARSSMHRVSPACAVSFGGYAAGPGGIAAWTRGIPLLVHEQNQLAGLTNRVLARVASRVLQAFPDTFPARVRPTTCGNPVRRAIAALPDPESRFFQRSGRPRVLVTGGSQGAGSLNRVVPGALALLHGDLRPLVCHQAGRGHTNDTMQRYGDAGVEAEVQEFIDDIGAAYAWADIVICRAGALTISELAAAGVGSILVPYPHAVDDHQSHNARYLSEAGAAIVLPEQALTADSLSRVLSELLGDRGRLLVMALAARSRGVTDAAEQVALACAEWTGT